MQWFPFQDIMLYTADNIKSPAENLKSLVKSFSMFKIRISYDEIIVHKYVLNAVGIMYINFGKSICFLLDNKTIEKFITTFVTNMVFHNVGLFWIIQPNQKLNFDIQHHFPSWIINVPWYNTMICSRLHVSLFEDYVTTARMLDYYNSRRSERSLKERSRAKSVARHRTQG